MGLPPARQETSSSPINIPKRSGIAALASRTFDTSRREIDEEVSIGGCSLDRDAQCEALVDQPAWMRLHNSSQCSRFGSPRGNLAGAILCWQHERFVESGGEIPLTGERLLVVDWRWSEDGWRREVLGTRVLENVVDLERRRRDLPPPGWGVVSEEQRRAAAEVMEAILGVQRPPHADRE